MRPYAYEYRGPDGLPDGDRFGTYPLTRADIAAGYSEVELFTRDQLINYQMKVSNMRNHEAIRGTQYDIRIGTCPWFWMWFFGPFYLMYKGLWGHAAVWILLCWTIVVPLFYIFKARELVYVRMLQRGELT